MGAWAAAADRSIVSISGDGGFGQYMAERQTAVKYGMRITHILLNNGEIAAFRGALAVNGPALVEIMADPLLT